MNETGGNHLSELDSLLNELHSATANNAKILRNDNAADRNQMFKPPLDNLINDLESSIKLNETRGVRSSTSYDGRVHQQPQPQSSDRRYMQETNIDDVAPNQGRFSAPAGAQDDTEEIYDIATISNSKHHANPEDIYDNAIYDTNYYVSENVESSEANRNSEAPVSEVVSVQSEFTKERVYSEQTNHSEKTVSNSNQNQPPSAKSRLSRGDMEPAMNQSKLVDGFPVNGDFQECYDAVTQKMASMGVHAPSKGTCEKCGMTIHGQIVTALGKLWHPPCFSCVLCVRQLAGETDFFDRHGEAFCESCYQQSFAPKCHQCNQPIIDTFVSALDQNWHPECFACSRCSLKLGEGEVTYHEGVDGKVYCGNCYSHFCAPKCRGTKCGGQSIDRQFISALGGQWHPECFVCAECECEFSSSGNFFEFEGKPYCETHYHKKRGSLCHRCAHPITGRCITAMGGKRFHPEHFVCVFCMKQLNKGTFKEYKQQPYCHPCFVKLFGGH